MSAQGTIRHVPAVGLQSAVLTQTPGRLADMNPSYFLYLIGNTQRRPATPLRCSPPPPSLIPLLPGCLLQPPPSSPPRLQRYLASTTAAGRVFAAVAWLPPAHGRTAAVRPRPACRLSLPLPAPSPPPQCRLPPAPLVPPPPPCHRRPAAASAVFRSCGGYPAAAAAPVVPPSLPPPLPPPLPSPSLSAAAACRLPPLPPLTSSADPVATFASTRAATAAALGAGGLSTRGFLTVAGEGGVLIPGVWAERGETRYEW